MIEEKKSEGKGGRIIYMEAISFSALLADRDVLVARFALFWHRNCVIEAFQLSSFFCGYKTIVVAQATIRLAKNLLPT